jgi:hypothetical protein
LYNAPTLSLTFGSRTTSKRQRCIFPPLGAQTPASRIRRIDSFGPTAVELDDGTRRLDPTINSARIAGLTRIGYRNAQAATAATARSTVDIT